jgi:hypothetical protein
VLLVPVQIRAQSGNTVCAGESTVLTVEGEVGVTYFWELYDDVTGINLAVVTGNCPSAEAFFIGGQNTGDSVEVMWLVPGTYFFKVTATDSCSENIKVGMMEVLACYSTAIFLEPEEVCAGDTAMMTIEISGGIGPWNITFTDGTTIWTLGDIQASPYTFPLIPTPTAAGAYPYWITSVTNGYGITNDTPSAPVTLIVKSKPVTSPIYRY